MYLRHLVLKRNEELATGEHEESLVPAVVRPEDIRDEFDDICALENVKKTLHEAVVLPLKRPELFSHGNLLSVSNLNFASIF